MAGAGVEPAKPLPAKKLLKEPSLRRTLEARPTISTQERENDDIWNQA
jgi:hypothetical protein